MHRFPNAAVRVDGSLHWDVTRLHREVLAGLRAAAAGGPVHGIGIDSWAVDYGLLDAGEELLGEPYSYRDSRTGGVAARVLQKIDAAELYAVTGVQQLPFNTIYQLVAAAGTPELEKAATLLLLPDLLGYWLTGEVGPSAPTPPRPGCTTSARGPGPPSSPTWSRCPPRSCRRCAPRATSSGRCCPTWPPSSG